MLQFALFQSGTPTRWYLMSQLLTLPKSAIKPIRLAILPAMAIISPELEAAIRVRLQTDNRTIAWSVAPGLLTAAAANDFNLSRVVKMVRLPGLTGRIDPGNITTALARDQKCADGSVAGAPPPRWSDAMMQHEPPALTDVPTAIMQDAAPWFFVNESAADVHVLGRFLTGAGAGLPAVVWHDSGTFRTFYSCSSTSAAFASVQGWRAVMQASGVHIYLQGDAFLGDVVEAAGRLLMVHAGPSTALPSNPPRARTVSLPRQAATVRSNVSGTVATVCTLCKQFDTEPISPGKTLLFEVVYAAHVVRAKTDDEARGTPRPPPSWDLSAVCATPYNFTATTWDHTCGLPGDGLRPITGYKYCHNFTNLVPSMIIADPHFGDNASTEVPRLMHGHTIAKLWPQCGAEAPPPGTCSPGRVCH